MILLASSEMVIFEAFFDMTYTGTDPLLAPLILVLPRFNFGANGDTNLVSGGPSRLGPLTCLIEAFDY